MLLVLAACSDNKAAEQRIFVTSVNGGEILRSDVETGGVRTTDSVEIKVRNDTKAGSGTAPTSTGTGSTSTDSTTTTGSAGATAQDVVVTKYKVSFSRADGGPVPGAFEGGTAIYAPANGSEGTGRIAVVLGSHKGSSPLSELAGGGSFTATARIELAGEDRAGNNASTVAYLTVSFGNWSDTTTTTTP
ncbi:MAG: hypothetical protein HY039_00595 [Nitrospirae bacterium]|nr:hypothetical protein [Nitrospirota bacterium]